MLILFFDETSLVGALTIKLSVFCVKKILGTKCVTRRQYLSYVVNDIYYQLKGCRDCKIEKTALQEVFHKSERPETVNSAVAPFNRYSINICYNKCYIDDALVHLQTNEFEKS